MMIRLTKQQLFPLLLIITGVLLSHLSHLYATEPQSWQVELVPSKHDLGEISDQKMVETVFQLQNQSSQAVTVERVETSCGCMAATPTPKTIPSGESAILKVEIDPEGKSDYTRWTMNVFFDNPLLPPVEAVVEAKVLREAVISHEYLYFGEFRRSKNPPQKKVWVSPPNEPNFKVTKVEQVANETDKPVDYFTIDYGVAPYDGFYPGERSAYWIKIAPKEDIPFGRISARLIIHSNSSEYQKLEIPILARVAGDIGVRPDYVSLGIIKPQRKIKRNLYVFHRKGKDFKIKKVVSKWPHLKIEVHTQVPHRYYKLKLSCKWNSKMKKGEFRSEIKIHTNDDTQPVVTVPLQGFVTK